ncbi:uncharacterized protein MELLADRAFT_109596 [Melampsora larici-populina 98AG31]|uniref:Uncharacterized protein n=1 Tax=Melampsora larici-populina (strain 98AG31 / pathotype 3-4-7) TaxID=747676 RepID=F4RX01_MELLP|nr:uncharacterized protein MELLADRAFT_109596 [Melampsora larici-populina 98AG31]EGG03131.1 hypothetical protein MELLADRAFT_109596 [Melampsora larici-populina 98AG31]
MPPKKSGRAEYLVDSIGLPNYSNSIHMYPVASADHQDVHRESNPPTEQQQLGFRSGCFVFQDMIDLRGHRGVKDEELASNNERLHGVAGIILDHWAIGYIYTICKVENWDNGLLRLGQLDTFNCQTIKLLEI